MRSHFAFYANLPADIHVPGVGSIFTLLFFVRVDGAVSAIQRKRLSIIPTDNVELNRSVSALPTWG